MRIFSLALLTIIAGCVTTDAKDINPAEGTYIVLEDLGGKYRDEELVSNSLQGAWNGEIVLVNSTELPFDDSERLMEVVLLNCGGPVEIWTKVGDSHFANYNENLEVISHLGNHVLSSVRNGRGWVETQSWGVISINNNRAFIQWNRMVSNPFTEDDDETRYFGRFGFGELERISMDCDIWRENFTDDGAN